MSRRADQPREGVVRRDRDRASFIWGGNHLVQRARLTLLCGQMSQLIEEKPRGLGNPQHHAEGSGTFCFEIRSGKLFRRRNFVRGRGRSRCWR